MVPYALLKGPNRMGIISWLIVGLIAGYLARGIMPGKDTMSMPQTLGLGLVGSLVGGMLGALFTDNPFELTGTGLIGSLIGALIALFVYNRVKTRS